MAKLDLRALMTPLDVNIANLYINTSMSFRCYVSCAKFELFASFLEWLLRSLGLFGNLLHFSAM